MERFIRKPLDFVTTPYRRRRLVYKLTHEHNPNDVLDAFAEIKTPEDMVYANTILNQEIARKRSIKPTSIHIDLAPEPPEQVATDIRRNLYGINSPGWQHSLDVLLVGSIQANYSFDAAVLQRITDDFTPWQQGVITSLCYWYGSSWHRKRWLPDMTNGLYGALDELQARNMYTDTLRTFSVPFSISDGTVMYAQYYREVHGD